MGDILKVVGFYNSAPIFQFMRRMNTVLSLDTDKTDEKELHTEVSQGAKVLEKELGLRLLEYTSTTDVSSKRPGHYVIFWELVAGSHGPIQNVLEQCCSAMEKTLNFIYRRGRHDKTIGPLELRVVQEGTFDLLVNHAVSQGATISQYKTPRGLGHKSQALLEILNSRVTQKAFCQDEPPFTPGVYRYSLSGRHLTSPKGRNVPNDSPTSRRRLLESKSGPMISL
jgi:auxin responsive GH3 family protein